MKRFTNLGTDTNPPWKWAKTMTTLAIATALALAFANGANDNAKGVATLIGGHAASVRTALWYAAGTALLGSLAAVLLAGGLVAKFSGKGLVDASLTADPAFLTSAVVAAAVTVLLAARFGMPISTTHALVGGICGAALAAHALQAANIVSAFVVPLLAVPLLAVVFAAPLYATFRAVRLRLGVARETCICVGQELHPVSLTVDGAVVMQATGLEIAEEATVGHCRDRYTARIVGLQAQRALDLSHIVTAGAVSFTRGLNDTPKIAAVMISLGAAGRGLGLSMIGITIAIGGLLAARCLHNEPPHHRDERRAGVYGQPRDRVLCDLRVKVRRAG